MTSNVSGIHHVTAICGDPQRNLDFYAGLLGMRLVKRTVNYDDPHTYHFYYGDGDGTPGSIVTFFPWPGRHAGRVGTKQIAVTSIAVPPGALGFWVERLIRHGVPFQGPTKRVVGRDVERVLSLRDPDGMMVELVGHDGAAARPAWDGAPNVPAEHATRGLHSVTLWVEHHEPTERVLVDTLGLRAVAEEEGTRRYAAGDGGPGTLVNVRAVGGFLDGLGGVGTVHHVAFRAGDDATELALRQQVVADGLHPTPVLDRSYFHSVYFEEPGGVLFELATDGPGFATDEPRERLGTSLQLPARYEPMRAELEAALPEIHVEHFIGAMDGAIGGQRSALAEHRSAHGEIVDAADVDLDAEARGA
ncbi:MAG: ring-cleaving dioxygenase [Gemmatirosa sp.]|nr:ring-cleaving dioxygenase [Gemmatirosa sp.]